MSPTCSTNLSNLSVFQRNTLACFVSLEAEKAYLWASDRCDERKAFKYANEVDTLCERLLPMLDAAANDYRLEAVPEGLLAFILRRHRNVHFPNT